uniref:Uncharacterized protein n=1 Tax=Anopheles maculatus TaxID=74869 RepID=A0A182T9E6_9DIPT
MKQFPVAPVAAHLTIAILIVQRYHFVPVSSGSKIQISAKRSRRTALQFSAVIIVVALPDRVGAAYTFIANDHKSMTMFGVFFCSDADRHRPLAKVRNWYGAGLRVAGSISTDQPQNMGSITEIMSMAINGGGAFFIAPSQIVDASNKYIESDIFIDDLMT